MDPTNNPFAPPHAPFEQVDTAGLPPHAVPKEAQEILESLRPWMTIVSVCCWLYAGIAAALSLGALASVNGVLMSPAALFIVFAGLATVLFTGGVLMSGIRRRLTTLAKRPVPIHLRDVLRAQNSLWVFMGVVSVLVTILVTLNTLLAPVM